MVENRGAGSENKKKEDADFSFLALKNSKENTSSVSSLDFFWLCYLPGGKC